jgi:hypothetical protein
VLLNIHLHRLVLDGVYLNHDGVPVFLEAAPLSGQADRYNSGFFIKQKEN